MGTIFYGGNIYTMRKENEKVEAVYVENGKIIDTGDFLSLCNKYENQQTEKKNLAGFTLFPGFTDSHLHMVGYGEKLMRLDLSNVSSAEQMKALLVKKAEETPAGEWVIGEGWDENRFFDRKIFHRTELDAITSRHPLLATRICRHAAIANTKALELAGIHEKTPDPPGGKIVRDGNGKPTGYLLDAAQDLVIRQMPKKSDNLLHRALSAAVDDLLQKGLVGGHTEDLHYHGGFKRTFHAFRHVIDGVFRKFRTHLLVHHQELMMMHECGYSYGEGTEFLRFDAVKIFADGALGGRTALLSSPYHDDPHTTGLAVTDRYELRSIVAKARKLKMPVAIHAIGDQALENALDAIEADPPQAGLRDRLIHCQIVRPDLIERLRKLPVVLDLQPQFVVSDFPWVKERIGMERLKHSYAWKTFLNQGILCAGGSDAPIEVPDPLLGIHAAVARRKPEEHHEGYLPYERLSVFEALRLYTVGSAFAVGKEGVYGRIAPGFVADFTILNGDPFAVHPDEIPFLDVQMTVVDGTIMYERATRGKN